jgi:DNA-binding response OmpR family regulator
MSVLVVEDQFDTAESTAELLSLFGCETRIAHTGEDALHAALVKPPDVVLLDIALPGINGWEVARRLRDQAVGRQPFLVAVTGFGGEDHRWRSADAGVDIHLVKPADPIYLFRLLTWIQGLLASSGRDHEPPPPRF